MKIDPTSIVRDHLDTLRNADTGRISALDLCTFFLGPIIVGAVCFFLGFNVSNDAHNVSITFFGIFTALLLNIQVAIFSIFQRKWTPQKDKRLADIQARERESRNKLLLELNANISYLVLFSTMSLVFTLIFFVNDWNCGLAPAVSTTLYSHFILTLVMIVKRSHALFHKEYRDNTA